MLSASFRRGSLRKRRVSIRPRPPRKQPISVSSATGKLTSTKPKELVTFVWLVNVPARHLSTASPPALLVNARIQLRLRTELRRSVNFLWARSAWGLLYAGLSGTV